MMQGALAASLPPGKYVTELWGYKVGDKIKNHFNRDARIAYLYEANDGARFLIYAYDKEASGVQLLQHAKREVPK